MLGDDPVQSPRALKLLAEPALIPVSVILETSWVLWRRASLSMADIAAVFQRLLDLSHIVVAERDAVLFAVSQAQKEADFADMLHLALSGGADSFATFDRRVARIATDPPVPIETLV